MTLSVKQLLTTWGKARARGETGDPSVNLLLDAFAQVYPDDYERVVQLYWHGRRSEGQHPSVDRVEAFFAGASAMQVLVIDRA